MNIHPYIVINGKSSREILGLIISSLPPISKPAMRAVADEIDGRDGDEITKLGFSAYDKTITIGLAQQYNVDDVIEYFNQDGIITFSNEPDKFYKFIQIDGIDFERLIRFKTAQVSFHVQPFKYSASESEKAFAFSNEATSGSLSIWNAGNYTAKPIIQITGSGNIDLTLNGHLAMAIDLSDVHTIILDVERMNAYASDEITLKNRLVLGDFENLILRKGRNTISYVSADGYITEILVNKYSRWL